MTKAPFIYRLWHSISVLGFACLGLIVFPPILLRFYAAAAAAVARDHSTYEFIRLHTRETEIGGVAGIIGYGSILFFVSGCAVYAAAIVIGRAQLSFRRLLLASALVLTMFFVSTAVFAVQAKRDAHTATRH